MTNSPSFFIGVLVLKDGSWTPHSKFDIDSFGSALMKAETLDEDRTCEGVKIMKFPTKKGATDADGQPLEEKEMWISPRLKARVAAQSAAKFRAGVKQTKEQLAAAHAQRKGGA